MLKHKKHQREYLAIALLLFLLLLTISGMGNNVSAMPILNFARNSLGEKRKIPVDWKKLFESPKSLGNLAIGHAEGNYTVTGQKTSLYEGHEDPGNKVWNSGFCSDQGRGRRLYNKLKKQNKLQPGTSILDLADQECIKYLKHDFDLINENMNKAKLDPNKNIEVLINAVDLRNQASPDTHPRFIQRYVQALKNDAIKDKIVWARVMAFRTHRWTATGLLGICRRERRNVSDFRCIEMDQQRRVRAIRAVLKNNILD